GLLICFFFFQAEDGIRDDLVTGVQTCALPISLRQSGRLEDALAAADRAGRAALGRSGRTGEALDLGHALRDRHVHPDVLERRVRSEERRVGKECRYWWAEDVVK